MTTTYTFDEDIVSDLHKDAYGIRPSRQFWLDWDSKTNDEKQLTWDCLMQALDCSIKAEEERTARAIAEFEKLVTTAIGYGASTRKEALRWILQTEESDDIEFIEYKRGLPYGYISKDKPYSA